MKEKFLKKIILFVMLFIPIYIGFIAFWADFAPYILKGNMKSIIFLDGSTYQRFKEAELAQPVDLIFVGSSRSYRGFDVRIFKEAGFSSINLGTSGQTPIQTGLILDEYLEKLNPKIVFMEVSPLTFSLSGVESSTDLVLNTNLNPLNVIMKSKSLMVVNCYVFKKYIEVFKRRKEAKLGDNDVYIPGGFVETKLTVNNDIKKRSNFKGRLSDVQVQALKAISEKLQKRKIRLILVQAPTMQSYYHSFDGNVAFDYIMRNYGHYINFNDSFPFDETVNFYDKLHLTQRGVELFNNKLIALTLR